MMRASLITFLAVACADPAIEAGGAAGGKADDTGGARGFYVTASTVEALDRDLSSVTPPIETVFGDPLAPEDYLRPMSCLGFYGPLGPWGPLGLLGPVGDDLWSPDLYVSGGVELPWADWARASIVVGGPLGPDGPLGDAYEAAGPFEAGAVFGVLGPVGPLGPMGPLGPLGPLGIAGDGARRHRDADGNYLRDGEVVRREDGWALYESYRARYARALDDNDTSFLVRGHAAPGEGDAYAFTSGETQIVTVAVLPESALLFYPQAMSVLFAAAAIGFETPGVAPSWRSLSDELDLELASADGSVTATSQSLAFVDWIQARVPAGTRLEARVTSQSTWSSWSPIAGDYRLFVVGSGERVQGTTSRGDFQR